MAIFLSLGSNIEDKKKNLKSCREFIKNITQIKIIKESPIYQSSPMHYIEQSDFLNQIIEIKTNLEATILLEEMQNIEINMGRKQFVRKKYQPRIIDIDILCYHELILNDDNYTLPHPEIYKRKFVLKPWADISPEYILPNSKMNIYEHYKKISHLEDTVKLFNL